MICIGKWDWGDWRHFLIKRTEINFGGVDNNAKCGSYVRFLVGNWVPEMDVAISSSWFFMLFGIVVIKI